MVGGTVCFDQSYRAEIFKFAFGLWIPCSCPIAQGKIMTPRPALVNPTPVQRRFAPDGARAVSVTKTRVPTPPSATITCCVTQRLVSLCGVPRPCLLHRRHEASYCTVMAYLLPLVCKYSRIAGKRCITSTSCEEFTSNTEGSREAAVSRLCGR